MEAGVAAHHAGMVPAFKEATEELFAAGLLGVVFATETLALGINMPARTVVLESLTKFTGETHQALEPGDYTQLTGRAGRRGIDHRGIRNSALFALRPFPGGRQSRRHRRSSAGVQLPHHLQHGPPTWSPTIPPSGLRTCSRLLSRTINRHPDCRRRNACPNSCPGNSTTRSGPACVIGGRCFDYLELLGHAKNKRGNWFETLRIGDVFEIPSGRRTGRYVVVRRLARRSKAPRVLAVSESGNALSMVSRDLVEGTVRMGHIEVPNRRRSDGRALHRQMAAQLRRLPSRYRASEQSLRDSRLRDHPVADCPELEVHLRHARRAIRTSRRLAHLQSGDDWATENLQNRFKAVRTLMEEWGYLSGWAVTPAGNRLRLIYNERDLLVSEAVIRGLFGGLNPAETAALGSVFVYDPRKSSPTSASWPTARLAGRWERLVELCEALNRAESSRQIEPTRSPEPGCGGDMYRWANGASLADLVEYGQTPGDFVRTARQLVDLLRQLRDAFPQISGSARSALRCVDRGVVAAHLNR